MNLQNLTLLHVNFLQTKFMIGTSILSINIATKQIINDNKQIIISDSPYDYYQLPTIIETHYKSIFSIHDTSNIFNSLNSFFEI